MLCICFVCLFLGINLLMRKRLHGILSFRNLRYIGIIISKAGKQKFQKTTNSGLYFSKELNVAEEERAIKLQLVFF